MPLLETAPLMHSKQTSSYNERKNGDIPRYFPTAVRRAAFLLFIAVVLPASVWKLSSREGEGKEAATVSVSAAGAESHDELWYHSWEKHLIGGSNLKAFSPAQNPFTHQVEKKLRNLLYFNHSGAFDDLITTAKSSAMDFYHYQQGWEAQMTQSYCAVATSAAVLNSLRGKIQLPQDNIYVPFPWATQKQLLLNEDVRKNIFNIDTTKRLYVGLGLFMVEDLLNYHIRDQGFLAKAHSVDPEKEEMESVIEKIKAAVLDDKSRVMINYDRGGIGQGPMGHGHFSPLGAYNFLQDAFLVMDVAKYKHPPVWVPSAKLFSGISTVDKCAIFSYSDRLPDFQKESLAAIKEELGCKEAHRGFIVIKPLS
eukprot:CAMPEP_0185734994 /NCGR_PEP_ID=MMETSP1171-20130828/24072_1 /TAXON_ID=374046 /ORGANISM="Helicotheca tamensis, Strain CCMP826" /LENGTH=365 /DNA_ID=CAMNT_0028405153 /DNA_START=157 /DNA_END=1254 /DNA_ORIENTATION=-